MNQMNKKIRVGIAGSGWISQVHVDALRKIEGVEISASWSRSEDTARYFSGKNSIPRYFTDWRDLVHHKDIDCVCVNTPNFLHAKVIIEAAKAGKNIICEKPLAITIEEAEEAIDACHRAGVKLCYAEELCFVPKFVRAKAISDQGALGNIYMVKQYEKHSGPYSPWFFKPEEAGGGILMDMGCHGIEFCRWIKGKKRVTSVSAHLATYLHGAITKEEDHSIVIIEMEDGSISVVESSWALKGGMSSTAEIYGTEGVLRVDLLKETGITVFSEKGYDSGLDETKGWTNPDYEWLWQNGYPQEMEHFINCIRTGADPSESGDDGLAVLEIMLAAYHSAATGKKVNLPFRPKGIPFPVDLWMNPRPSLDENKK